MTLEARDIGERYLSPMDMHAAHLGAAVQLREHLAGVQQAVRVERAFQALLLVQIGLVELDLHKVALLHPDAVFTGENAADLDAEFRMSDPKASAFSNSPGLLAS